MGKDGDMTPLNCSCSSSAYETQVFGTLGPGESMLLLACLLVTDVLIPRVGAGVLAKVSRPGIHPALS